MAKTYLGQHNMMHRMRTILENLGYWSDGRVWLLNERSYKRQVRHEWITFYDANSALTAVLYSAGAHFYSHLVISDEVEEGVWEEIDDIFFYPDFTIYHRRLSGELVVCC